MKVAYIRPYVGEVDIVIREGLDCVAAHCVFDIDESVRNEIQVLSVFVDYNVTRDVINAFPQLKLIATRSAGFDHVDMFAAAERGIVVTRVPHYGTRTVAEYAFALMFSLARNAYRSYTDMQRDSSVVNFEAYEGFDLAGKTLGVIGTGAIGKSVCAIARGIGMHVLAYDVAPDEVMASELGITYSNLEEVLAQADIVTLHVPSIPATHHLMNDVRFAVMKKGSYLINTARGDVVDTKALVAALHDGHLAGAALDVLEGEHALREEAELLVSGSQPAGLWETLVANHALIDMQNVIVTPHIAFNTKEAKREITDITISNIKAFIAGEAQNIVAHEKDY